MLIEISAADVADFFDKFCREFASFDGRRVGGLFVAPGIALRSDGETQGFATQQDIENYYQSALDRYRSTGCAECRWRDLQVAKISEKSIVATVSWELIAKDMSLLRKWRQAYFISRFSGQLKAYGSAFVSNEQA
jgi:hypothetical protein